MTLQRIRDYFHERKVQAAFRRARSLQLIGAPQERLRSALSEFTALVRARSQNQVARMERARGLR